MRWSKLSRWMPKSLLKPESRKPRAKSLGLERLEARDNPAVYTWDGGAGTQFWLDAANWDNGNTLPNPLLDNAIQIVIPAGITTFQNIDFMTVDRLTLGGNNTIFLTKQLGLDGSAAGDQIVSNGANNLLVGVGGMPLSGTAPRINVTAGSALTLSTDLTGTVTSEVQKDGTGTLTLNGNNTFAGKMHVRDGLLQLNNANANQFPVPATELIVGDSIGAANSAEVRLLQDGQYSNSTKITVQTDGLFNVNGHDVMSATLVMNGGTLDIGTGGIYRANGDITVNGDSKMTGGLYRLYFVTPIIDVAAGKTFTIASQMNGPQGIYKTGAGTLSFQNPGTGAAANSYTGTTTVADGTLALKDTAVSSAFQGPVIVGDGTGLDSSAILRLDTNHEIPNGMDVRLRREGLFDLNGFSDTINSLIFDSHGKVTTGAGILTIADSVKVYGGGGLYANEIDGNLTFSGANPTLDIANNPAATDLLVNGTISSPNGLIKTGQGLVEFKATIAMAANTIGGTTWIKNGTLVLNDNHFNTAVSKTIVIGDGVPDAGGKATLLLGQPSEIDDSASVTVNSDGLFDLNNFTDTIGALTLGDATGGGTVSSGSGSVRPASITTVASATSSVISGNLLLVNNSIPVTVADGSAAVDLQINASVLNGGFIKNGAGVLQLSGTNTLTGPSVVNAGNLVVSGSLVNSPMQVNGGTLSGSGSVGNIVGGAGILAPGGSPGSISTKNLVAGNNTYVAEIAGTAAGQFDQIKVTGSVDLTGSTLTTPMFFTSNTGDQFKIIDNDGNDAIAGTFNNLPEGATFTVGSRTYQISYVGGDGNDVVLTDVTPIPVDPPVVPLVVPPVVPPADPPVTPNTASVANQFAAGSDAGGSSVRLFNPDQSERLSATPFPGFTGGMRTAAADFNNDGVADLVVGTGPGGASHLKVLDGKTGNTLFSMDPFEASFTGGVYVAAGDVNGDGIADLIVTPDEGGGPRVRVFDGKTFSQIADFFGIDDPNFRGGARAAIGDLNGDGVGDVIVAAGFGGGPRVAGFDGKTLGSGPKKVIADFLAFEPGLRNGIYVAAGDVNGDGKADLIAGGGPGGGPRVTVFDGKDLANDTRTPVANFLAGDPANRGGVRVAAKNLDGDKLADVVTGAGSGAGSRVTGYLGKSIGGSPASTFDLDAFPGFTGGVFVG